MSQTTFVEPVQLSKESQMHGDIDDALRPPYPNQPRTRGTVAYDEIPISRLVGSFGRIDAGGTYIKQIIDDVRKCGVITPVRVMPLANNQYRVIDGNKRILAAIKTGHEVVPCAIEKALAPPATTLVTSRDGKRALYVDGQLALVYTDNPDEMLQDTLDVLTKAEAVRNEERKCIGFSDHIRQFPTAL